MSRKLTPEEREARDERKRVRRREHYRLNREHTLAVNQAYREKNPELIARLKKQWADANKPRLMARLAEKRRAQPKSVRQLEGEKYRMKRGDALKQSQFEYYRQHKPRLLVYQKTRREGSNREEIIGGQRRRWLQRWLDRAGWSLEEYHARREAGCEICGGQGGDTPHSGLVFDHDHDTGVVRGLLCARCNRFLDWAIEYHDVIKEYHHRQHERREAA